MKKILKCALISLILMLVTYAFALFVIYGHFRFELLIMPYAYMIALQVELAKIIAFSVGLLFASICFFVYYTKKTNADLVLSIFSFFIPLVGFVVGIIYRVRDNNISISNCYLLTAMASVATSILILLYFYISVVPFL